MEAYDQVANEAQDEPYVYVFEALGRFFEDGKVQHVYRVGTTKRLRGFMSKFTALNRPRRFALLHPIGEEDAQRRTWGWPDLAEHVADGLKCGREPFVYKIEFGLKWFTTSHNSTTVDTIVHKIFENRVLPPAQPDFHGGEEQVHDK